MKSPILLIFILLSISSLLKPEEIDVMFNRDFYPFEFINEDGIPDGFIIDIIFAVAREAALEVRLVEGNWRFREDLLFNGKIDIAPGYLITSKNPSVVRSKPLFLIHFILLYSMKDTIFDSNSLKNKIIVLSSGDSSDPLLTAKEFAEKTIRTKSWTDSIKALSADYGDFTIISKVHYNLLESEYKNNVKVVNSFSLDLPFGFYSAKWNSNDLEKINNGISIIKASGEFDKIYKKWFGNSENLIKKRSDSNRRTNIYIAAAVLLVAMFIFYINKRKVKK